MSEMRRIQHTDTLTTPFGSHSGPTVTDGLVLDFRITDRGHPGASIDLAFVSISSSYGGFNGIDPDSGVPLSIGVPGGHVFQVRQQIGVVTEPGTASLVVLGVVLFAAARRRTALGRVLE